MRRSRRRLAERALREGGDNDAARTDFVARRLLARSLSAEEQPLVERSLASLLTYYRDHAEDAKQLITFGESQPDAGLDPAILAGYTMLANELLNLDEALNK